MALKFSLAIGLLGVLGLVLGHGHIEPLPEDPSWCVNGNILQIGECLCEREKEDSCEGSKCFRQMGLSWYKPSCKDCRCKPEDKTEPESEDDAPSATGSQQQPPAQCGQEASSGCGGKPDSGEGMPDWFGEDPPPKKKANEQRRESRQPNKNPAPQQQQQQQQQQPSMSNEEMLRLLQAHGSPADIERNRRHKIVGAVSFGFAAVFALLFWMSRGAKRKRTKPAATPPASAASAKKAPTKTNNQPKPADGDKADTKTDTKTNTKTDTDKRKTDTPASDAPTGTDSAATNNKQKNE